MINALQVNPYHIILGEMVDVSVTRFAQLQNNSTILYLNKKIITHGCTYAIKNERREKNNGVGVSKRYL